MTSSGTTTFNMPIDDIIRRAYSRFGQTSPSGYDMRQAMTALNLILQDLASGLTWSIADETFKTGPIEMNASMRETERLRRDQLRQRYEEEVNRVIDEDRTRVSMFILPDLGRR
jgi:hypothetical protein